MCFYLVILILGSGHFFLGSGLSGIALVAVLHVSGFPISPFARLSPAPLLVLEEEPSFDWFGNPAVLRGDMWRWNQIRVPNFVQLEKHDAEESLWDVSTFALRCFSQEHLMKPRPSAPPPKKWVFCPPGWKRDLPSRCWLHPLKVPCFCLLSDLFLQKNMDQSEELVSVFPGQSSIIFFFFFKSVERPPTVWYPSLGRADRRWSPASLGGGVFSGSPVGVSTSELLSLKDVLLVFFSFSKAAAVAALQAAPAPAGGLTPPVDSL